MIDGIAVLRLAGWSAQERGQVAAALAAEFPSVYVGFKFDHGQPLVRATEWTRPDFDHWHFDERVDAADGTICVADDSGACASFPLEVLTRCQRAIDRRNQFSEGPAFDRALARHRALHDLSKPLVRADYNHALDVWQWVLRLDPHASRPLQIAALFHDIERLASEADARVEHLAPDYQQFKDAHARAGAAMTLEATGDARAAELVASHERPSDDPDVALLNDADALSFFSLNSSGYADYFGTAQTRKKIAYTWNRMRPAARAKLAGVRLRRDVRAMLDEVTA